MRLTLVVRTVQINATFSKSTCVAKILYFHIAPPKNISQLYSHLGLPPCSLLLDSLVYSIAILVWSLGLKKSWGSWTTYPHNFGAKAIGSYVHCSCVFWFSIFECWILNRNCFTNRQLTMAVIRNYYLKNSKKPKLHCSHQ